MDKIINMKTHTLLIELATRKHSYFISSIEQSGFPHDVAHMHNVQIRDLRVHHCLFIDV